MSEGAGTRRRRIGHPAVAALAALAALALAACGAGGGPPDGFGDLAVDAPDAPDAGLGDLPVDASAPFASPEWITDPDGRVLVLRGLNVDQGAKGAKPPDIGPADARRIARDWGFGYVRLLMTWEAVMPVEGQVDAAFLDALAARVDLLWAEGIRVMLDMHQDVWARRFCCDGAPDWAVRDDGLPFELQSQWFLNYFQPAVQRCFDHFWAADAGEHPDLQRQFVAAWAAVATRFRDHPGVVGYDLFNEPHPGSDLDLGELLGTPNPEGPHPAFDRDKLWAMYQRALDAIRAVDPDRWVFVEPRYGAPGNGLASYHPTLSDPRPGPARVAYAPHLYSLDYEQYQRYDPATDTAVADWERERAAEIARQPMPLVLGEWGFDWTFPGAAGYGQAVLDMADRLRAGWAYWSYGPGTWGLWNADGTERPAADVIVRPYARAVAGRPVSWSFDPATRIFRLEFDDVAGVTGPTEIHVPARHYAGGWSLVAADGAGESGRSFDADRRVLSVWTPRTGGRHVLLLSPAAPGAPPPAS
jgi:endoglycosylceramidase